MLANSSVFLTEAVIFRGNAGLHLLTTPPQSSSSEPVFSNVYGAQELIPRMV
jgi:hypothetical protein